MDDKEQQQRLIIQVKILTGLTTFLMANMLDKSLAGDVKKLDGIFDKVRKAILKEEMDEFNKIKFPFEGVKDAQYESLQKMFLGGKTKDDILKETTELIDKMIDQNRDAMKKSFGIN